jgi:hypothetical protein
MKLRFQADNDLDERIITATKRLEPAIDFKRASEIGLHLGVSDDQVLALAAKEGRVLVTHDRRTMPSHFEYFISHNTSPGLIIISRLSLSDKRRAGCISSGPPAKQTSTSTRFTVCREIQGIVK